MEADKFSDATTMLMNDETTDAVSMDKLRLSSLIKMSTTKSRLLISKKALPSARHERFRTRKPWRVSQPRLEKRLLVKATLDKALRVLSRHQSHILNGEEGDAATTAPAANFDDVDVGSWTLVRSGDRTLFHEASQEPETSTTLGKRARDAREESEVEPSPNDKRFKADRNNNGNEETAAKGHGYEEANNADAKDDDDDDDDVIIDIESESEPEKKETVTRLDWQWQPMTSNVGYYPPPPPPISPPLPPHLLQPQPQPAAAFDYDYYFYCLRFFYHYQRFCAAKGMTETNASFVS